jgi:hypothetical protein
VATPLIVAALVLLPMLLGDRQGFEGDGLAMLFGMNQFEILGRAGVYRYHWQPLSYELLSALGPWFNKPFSLTYVAQGFGGAGLALLYLLLARVLGNIPFQRCMALVLTLCIPELWITTLYFNTTALALPFITGGLLALHHACIPRLRQGYMLLAGVLVATGCLFRLDFAVFVPMILVLPWFWAAQDRIRTGVYFSAGGLATAAVFLAWQPHFIADAAAILQRYGEGEFSVTLVYRLKIVLFAMGPALVILPVLWWTTRSAKQAGLARHFDKTWLLWWAALLPTLIPLKNLYSGKYLLPFFMGLILLAAQAVARNCRATRSASVQLSADAQQQTGVWLATGCLVALALIGVPTPEALKSHPFTAWAADPLVVGTHDGARSAGAYLSYLKQLDDFELPQNSVRFYKQLSEVVDQCRNDVTVLMSPVEKYGRNEWSWGWLPLYLMQQGWQLLEYRAGQVAHLQQPASGHQVRILSSDQRGPGNGPHVLDMSVIGMREDYGFWTDAERWIMNPDTRAVCK